MSVSPTNETTPDPREIASAVSHPAREELELGCVLHALSDPMRLRIVAALADDGEMTCGGFGLPVSKSTCTHHFKVLRLAGVIRQRVDGTARLNSLRRADLEARFPGLVDAVLCAAAAANGILEPDGSRSPAPASH
jgi:DNA-binding transcriptional ArsR family regulator